MTRISDEQLDAIVRGCEGVTPGPWGEGDKWVFASPRSGNPSHALEHIFRNEEAQANAEHVARLDPQTVLSLVTELLHSRAEEAVARELLLNASIHLEEWPGNDDASQRDKAMRIVGQIDEFLSASPASPSATGVRVKPLEWQTYERGQGQYADGIFGRYTAGFYGDEGSWSGPWSGSRTVLSGGIAAAKAAAQSDYDARVLSALVEQP